MLIFSLLVLFAIDTPVSAAPTPAKVAANAPDKIICRQFPVTGSFIQTSKTCKTRAEWDRERDALRSGPTSSAECHAGC